MSDKLHTSDVRVINDEYERVLSNPDNLIVSEELQELIDLPIESADASSTEEAPVDTAILTVLERSTALPVTVRGELIELSYTKDTYTFIVQVGKVRQAFIQSLEAASQESETFPLIIGGIYEAEVQALITGWSFKNVSPHTYQLTVNFRSEDGIF